MKVEANAQRWNEIASLKSYVKPRYNHDEHKRGLNNIIVTRPPFKWSSDPKKYFGLGNQGVKSSSKLTICQFHEVKAFHHSILFLAGMKWRMTWKALYWITITKTYFPSSTLLRQGSKNVDEFFEEFGRTRLRANFDNKK